MARLIDADKLRKQMSEDYAQGLSKISNPTVKAIVEKAVETFDGYIVGAETVDAIPVDWLMQKADEWGMVYGKQFLIEAQRAWKE